jgi:hypothetical protein
MCLALQENPGPQKISDVEAGIPSTTASALKHTISSRSSHTISTKAIESEAGWQPFVENR